MKLYPIAPDAESVARHFDRMASGKVHTSCGQRAGYGFLGSRINLGSYSVMKGGAGTKENPQTVRGITPTEVGIQQAKSELQAKSHLINTTTTTTTKKKIKPKGATGKGQSKPGQRGSQTSAKGSGGRSKTSAKGRGAKKRKTKKEEAVELKRLAASKKKKKKVKAAGKKKTDNFS